MTTETNNNPPLQRQRSVRNYASKLFKESSVSAVAAIVSTGNVPRKVFRVLVFVSFTAGFLYQCIKFLCYVMQYPTIINIEMNKPDKYLAPAYTFCNANGIKRSQFCAAYPNNCVEADEELCTAYPHYCRGNNTKVPDISNLNVSLTTKAILELGHKGDDMLVGKGKLVGPLPRANEEEFHIASCFALNDRVDNSLEPKYMTRKIIKFNDAAEFVFDPEEDEMFYPNSEPGVLFSIHSPFEAVNPFEKGIFMKPGFLYRISVELREEHLLPYPYKTDCMNYTEMWVNANRTGPRSQQMCRHRCLRNIMEHCYNCSHPLILYPSRKGRFCMDFGHVNSTEECKRPDILVKSCVDLCKEDCRRMKFSYKVQETYLARYSSYRAAKNLSLLIRVKIYFEDQEILTIRYQPQFQEVEAFSYIGGFIGIWLGVSLVQVVDVFESIFLIARYFFKKGTVACSRKHKPPPVAENNVV